MSAETLYVTGNALTALAVVSCHLAGVLLTSHLYFYLPPSIPARNNLVQVSSTPW